MVFAIVPQHLHFHIELTLTLLIPPHQRFSGKAVAEVLLVRGVHPPHSNVHHIVITALFVISDNVLFLNKTFIVVLRQIDAHDERISRTDSCPQRPVLNELLLLPFHLEHACFGNIVENRLDNLLAVAVFKAFHGHAHKALLAIFASPLPFIKNTAAVLRNLINDLPEFIPLIFDHRDKGIAYGLPVFCLTVAVDFPGPAVSIDDFMLGTGGKLDDTARHSVVKLSQKISLALILNTGLLDQHILFFSMCDVCHQTVNYLLTVAVNDSLSNIQNPYDAAV